MEIINGINENAIIWEEFISEKGTKYEIGYLNDSETPIKREKEIVNSKRDFGISCDWYPTSIESWKNTSSGFKSVSAISRYSVNNHGGTYAYIINFTNEEHYDYYFYDETGDSYRCNTFRNGDHWIRYNSSSPRIIYIKGD